MPPGGEPTINEDLPGFIQRAKGMGFDVKLDTNGSNPGQLEYLLREKLVDYLALDIKTSLPKYAQLTNVPDIAQRVTRSIYLTMLATIPYEFRTTCVPGVVDDKDFRLIGETVKGAKKYCLQQFRPLNTYDKNFENITPYKKEDLRRFRNILEGFVEVVEIRGI